jgi:DNA-binding helix-hairpin-helix protein with protein kinase domain
VPLRNDAGEALEKDIQAYRYAYAPDGHRRGFKPPPKSIPITIVPDHIQAMFTLAFTENGANGSRSRPTAQQWVTALDDLRGQLKRCAVTSMHVYPGHLGRCPWCELEDHGVIYFLDVQVGVTTVGTTGFVLARVWAAIEAVPPPPAIPIPNIATIAVAPTPLPPGIKNKVTITFWRIVIVAIAFWLFTVIRRAWFIVLGGAWLAWAMVGDLGADERKAERTKRQAAKDAAKQEYDQIVGRIKQEISHKAFEKKKQDLARLRDEYQQLPEREKAELANLHATAEARQKRQFLERHFIDEATISGVGPSKKAALRSFGIETAADVTWAKVIAVKGFGEVLTRAVVDWQKACERRFVFNPSIAVTDADKNAVRAQIAARKRTIENALTTGAAELQRISKEMSNKANTLMPLLQAASQKLAQARADLNAV